MFLYVIKSESGPVKIGITADVEHRLSNLQTGSYALLTIAHKIKLRAQSDAQYVERLAHASLKNFRISGEWFSCSAEDAVEAVNTAYIKLQESSPWYVVLGSGANDVDIPLDLSNRATLSAAALKIPVDQFVRIAIERMCDRTLAQKRTASFFMSNDEIERMILEHLQNAPGKSLAVSILVRKRGVGKIARKTINAILGSLQDRGAVLLKKRSVFLVAEFNPMQRAA